MKQTVLRETLKVDENNQLHISIPAEMGEQVEVIVFSSKSPQQVLPGDTAVDNSGFAKNVLHSREEDCWNDL